MNVKLTDQDAMRLVRAIRAAQGAWGASDKDSQHLDVVAMTLLEKMDR